GIFDALKFLDCGLLDFADHAAERNVAVELDAGRGDRFDRNQRRGKAALHIVGAEPKNPAVAIDRLGLKSLAGEMLLPPGIGCVHVSGEKEVEPMPATAPMPDRIRPAGIARRQIGVHAGAAHARDEILRDADLVPRRAADVHQLHEQRAQIVAADIADGFVKTGMEHTNSYTKPSQRFTAGAWPIASRRLRDYTSFSGNGIGTRPSGW